ncbi:MAG: hypothetical protein J6A01_08410, partial [Proteobacteria bacterium]|nr:hypothetical protein [Pseudomonadota bacterium]
MNKLTRHITIIAIALAACACTEESNKCTGSYCCEPACGESEVCYNNECIVLSEHPDTCVPECTTEQTCYKNQCIILSEHPDICIPKCKGTKVCLNNECVKLADHPEICIPKCGDGQICSNNRCVDANTICTPACEDPQICENGHCVDPNPNACSGKLCRDDKTFCNDSGQWEECPSGTGCHIGYCIQGLNKECEDDTCDANHTHACKDGVWIECDAPAKCVENDESAECIIEEDGCASGTCSANGHYFCNSDGQWESCGEGFECKNGECEQTFDDEASLLWTLCQADSECSTGKCLKYIVTSRALTRIEKNITLLNDTIAVSKLDSRIPENYGICSADCTQNPDVCEQISTDKVHYSCQLAVIGDSPYPPKDENLEAYSLPFAHVLNLKDMKTAPFGAICRPDDSLKLAFSDKFCNSCENSEQCGEGENCIYGECLPKCSVNTQCPLGFTCSEYSDTNEKYCMPPEQICGDCIDRDKDGQGYGHCTRTGFDCDDLNPNVNYTDQLPNACVDNSDDTNCNGMIDQYELRGTPDHCAKCGDSCHPVENANIVRNCELENPDISVDKTTSDGLLETFKYICHEECAVGYADCDGDPTNGCETRLVDFSDDYLTTTAIHAGVLYAPDTDNDTYGDPDARSQIFCCPANEAGNAACYKLPNLNDLPEEVTSFNWEPAEAPTQETGIVALTSESFDKLSDCNDNNATVYPGAPEICDGLNNDCDPSSPDGKDDIYTLSFTDGSEITSKLGESCQLYREQPENMEAPSCGSGKTACTLMSTAAFGMDCLSDVTSEMTEQSICEDDWNLLSDEDRNAFCADICNINQMECLEHCQNEYMKTCLCDGIDNNCDGRIDEDWHFETCTLEDKVGICRMGILTCGQKVKLDAESGKELTIPAAVCRPLFYKADGRGYDFFGDGIDSNCDGEDFDKSSTLFVTPYFGSGEFEPTNNGKGEQKLVPGMGLYYAPYVSLKKALSVACSQTTNGVTCRDILVNSHKGSDLYHDWQTEDIKIPVYNSKDVYRPEFYTHERTLADDTKTTVETWTHEEIVEEYEHQWKEAFQYHGVDYETVSVSADTSKYLLEGEIYPKELVRIIGGMKMQEVVKDGKKVPVWTQTGSPTEYAVNITYDEKNAD